MVEASKGESSCSDGVDCDGIVGDGIVLLEVFLFILRKKVEMVLESGARDFGVIGDVVQVGDDGAIVAFKLLGIDAVVKDAAVLLHFQFVAEPVCAGSVTLVFGGI